MAGRSWLGWWSGASGAMLLMLPLLSRLNQYGLQAYIKAAGASAETQTGDAFGKAVATDGDTLAVGAPSQASSTGAVYLYTRVGEGGQWAPGQTRPHLCRERL